MKNPLFDLDNMPDEIKPVVTRMHHRMQSWRTENPKVEATIFWRTPPDGTVMIISTIRMAIQLGFVHVNQSGYDMIRAMCEPEQHEPTLNMVRAAIELEDK